MIRKCIGVVYNTWYELCVITPTTLSTRSFVVCPVCAQTVILVGVTFKDTLPKIKLDYLSIEMLEVICDRILCAMFLYSID